MTRWITMVVFLAVVFFGGWLLGRRTSRPEVVETVRIDTVFYERPHLVSKSDITVNVNVPKFIFAENKPNPDTVTNQVSNQETNYVSDSVQMQVIMRTLEYRDSTYYARVVGPVIGSMTPRLDYIETYNKTITRTVTTQPRFKLSAGTGTEYSRTGWTPFAEINFAVDLKFATISATVGADDIFKSPVTRAGIKASVPLWSK